MGGARQTLCDSGEFDIGNPRLPDEKVADVYVLVNTQLLLLFVITNHIPVYSSVIDE